MNIRELFGEIDGSELVEKGNNIKVYYYENGTKKDTEGILVKVNRSYIIINGILSMKKIEVNNIIKIEKQK